MAEKWLQKGVVAPLFDRLCDYEPNVSTEPVPFVTYTKKQLIESIQFEVENLLNTRCTMALSDYADVEPSILTYGIPDLFGLPDGSYADASSKEGKDRLAKLLANSIRIFEPRLRNVSLDIELMDPKTQSAHAVVRADLVIGEIQETISFPISVSSFKDVADREAEQYDTTAKLVLPSPQEDKSS